MSETLELPDIANTSGNPMRTVPPQARGGSWGAFVFGGVWALSNGVWFGALSFLAFMAPFMVQRYSALNTLATLLGIGVWLYITARGRTLAWRHKRWASYAHFHAVQRRWSKVAKVVFGVTLLLSTAFAVAFWLMLSVALTAMKG